MASHERAQFIESVNKIVNPRWKTLFLAVVQTIPYVGSGLAQLIQGQDIPAVYAGNYPSILEENLLGYIERFSANRKVLIIIDEAQNLSEDSYTLIANLAVLENVKLVLSITQPDNFNYLKLKNHLSLYNSIQSNILFFRRPEEELIRELSKSLSINLTENEINNILADTKQNIHLIFSSIINFSLHSSSKLVFTEIEKAIVSCLNICKFGLSSCSLTNLLSSSYIYSPNLSETIQQALTNLNGYACISQRTLQNQCIFYLSSLNYPEVQKCLKNISSLLYYKNLVYEYIKKNQDSQHLEQLELLSPNVKVYALSLVEARMRGGKKISNKLVSDAQFFTQDDKEIQLCVLYLTQDRRYREALNWLELIHNKSRSFHYRVFKGVLLNRVRQFEDAESSLLEAISPTDHPRTTNGLLAYYTANCIHTKQSHKAIDLFQKAKPKLAETENWGYVLRNIASAVPFPEKEEYLYAAINNFENYSDTFGVYSCKSNWGNTLCRKGQAKQALPLLLEAEEGMQRHGIVHLHIVYNNLAVCYLMLGDPHVAGKYITLANKIAQNPMPMLITIINKACIDTSLGNVEVALTELEEIESQALSHLVSNVRKRYFKNRMLVECSKGDTRLESFLQKYQKQLDAEIDKELVFIYKKMAAKHESILYLSEEWQKLYTPAGLAYWYIDPLKMI